MARIDFRPWAALALSAAVLGYVGCSSSNSTSSSPTPPSPAGPRAAGPSSPKGGAGVEDSGSKILANFGNPAAVLLFTGEMNGYTEPCGCTENQIGGLLRRYDFLERLRKQNWSVASFDLGGLTHNPAAARGGFEQAKFKFDYSIRALKLLNYSALSLSAEDMKVGVGEALALFLNSLGESTKIVAANIEAPAGFESIFRSSLIVPAGPVKVGVTAVIDPEALEKLSDPDKDLLVAGLKRPGDVLPGVLAELEPKTEYQVLMVQGPPKLARSLAQAYPGFDIVVATSEYIDVPEHDPQMLNNGKTLFVQVGQRGKYVGVVGLYPGESERLRYQLVTLGTKFNGPATAMKKLIEEEYRDTLRQIGVVENFPRRDFVNGVTGATYVGAENCKSCHPNTFMKWSTTKHALAYESLAVKDPKPNVIYDAECVTCHTTGFEYNSGWKSAEATPYLKGNQCENCHGPGSKHLEKPDNKEYLAAMALTPEKAEKNRLCQGCHDGDNSPKFEFGTYYPQVAHKGLDEYKDPKVHRGITPRLARSNPAGGHGESTPK
jgi:hypothetical protein